MEVVGFSIGGVTAYGPWFDNGIIYVTILMMVGIREYHDRGGHVLFAIGSTD
jgi:hypothetical protein